MQSNIVLNYGAINSLLKCQYKKRPVLGCIIYDIDKTIKFTNSYIAVIVTDGIKRDKPFLLDVKTLTQANYMAPYPSLDRLFSGIDYDSVKNGYDVELSKKGLIAYNVDGSLFEKKQLDTVLKAINMKLDYFMENVLIKKNYLLFKDDVYQILILGLLE